MRKTEENTKSKNKEVGKIKKEKHKTDATLGDIIFRVLVIVVVFFIVLIAYVSYIQGIKTESNNKQLTQNITRTVVQKNN